MNVGVAEVDISPDFEVELCGFAARVQPSAGILEPIFARAIHLEHAGERLLWIACDLIALDRATVENFRGWASSTLNLKPHQVLLCATHTHGAPSTIPLNGAGAASERFLTFLRAKLGEVAQQAMKTMPCRVLAGSTSLELSRDRRRKPSAHVDPTVWTLAFKDDRDNTLAAIVNYAMHPVALGHVERRISPDWCGAAARALRQALNGNPVTLITNGAAGNINPPREGVPVAEVEGYGRAVGEAAARALAGARLLPDELHTASIEVAVPLDVLDRAGIDRAASAFVSRFGPAHLWAGTMSKVADTWRAAMNEWISSGKPAIVPIEVQVARIGDVNIVAVNGEMFSRFADLVRRGTNENVFVVAYANTAFGYIPTREAYAEGGYEVDEAHFFYNSFRPAVGGLELLADRAIELLKR